MEVCLDFLSRGKVKVELRPFSGSLKRLRDDERALIRFEDEAWSCSLSVFSVEVIVGRERREMDAVSRSLLLCIVELEA